MVAKEVKTRAENVALMKIKIARVNATEMLSWILMVFAAKQGSSIAMVSAMGELLQCQWRMRSWYVCCYSC